ncbi:glucose-6-phosphate dehydrogenase [Spirochaeta thermophila]|nr:glucose-6-phosphate dehydrogenase [Spirochaeta thermophila]
MSRSSPLELGLSVKKEAPPCTLVIFGITGNLARIKLVPALYALYVKGFLPETRIVGFARRPWDDATLKRTMEEALKGQTLYREDRAASFLTTMTYHQATFDDPEGYRTLASRLLPGGEVIFYLATPPQNYPEIIEGLGEAGLSSFEGKPVRLVIEKPFGRDLESAGELNRLIRRWFGEEQIFRIDHYLGKETVQNLLSFRFGNGIFEPVLNNRYVDHIQITVAEKIGVEGRANYYEQAGALRDMVQNHLLQILALTMMEPPLRFEAEAIRDEKVKVLRALAPPQPREVVRAQYTAGVLDGAFVPGYREEPGVDPSSTTETFVALRTEVRTWRWTGVPVYLRTGKRLARKVSEVSIHFRRVPHTFFWEAPLEPGENVLVVRIQPDEGMSLRVNVKRPGYRMDLRPAWLEFDYERSFAEDLPEAYERLLLDALIGDAVLYTRADEVEASWSFVDEVRRGWEEAGVPIHEYAPGSAGPREARYLLSREGRRWRIL